MIEGLNGRHILGGFNQIQIWDFSQGVQYEITNEIFEGRVCMCMYVCLYVSGHCPV